MEKITKETLDKEREYYEEQLTEAYSKRSKIKFKALQRKFYKIVKKYTIDNNVEVNYAYISPSTEYNKVEIVILEGSIKDLKKIVDKILENRKYNTETHEEENE